MITAPVSGYVNSIDVNTIGQYTAAGTQLITIVPDGRENRFSLSNNDYKKAKRSFLYTINRLGA